MKLSTKIGILAGSALIGSGSVAYWMTTPSYALFDMAYVSKDVKTRFDLDSFSKYLTDAALEEVSRQTLSEIQGEQNGFAQFGKMIGMGMLQQMRPAIEIKIKDELSKAIAQSDASGSRSFKNLHRQGDEAVVTLVRDGKELDLVMEKKKGMWKFTKFSDRTTKEFLASMRQDKSSAVATTDFPATSSETTAQLTPSPRLPNNPAQVTTPAFNAEIFDPPSNCRSGPGSNNPVEQALQNGDILVDRDNPQMDDKGNPWYREQHLNCWLHHSQVRFK
jgi:hypothetical protein